MKTKDLIYQYIKGYFKKHCYAPSYEEITTAVGISKSTLNVYMKRFFDEGLLETDVDNNKGVPRAFRPKGYKCTEE